VGRAVQLDLTTVGELRGPDEARVEDRPESWPVRRSEDIWRGGMPFAVRRDLVSVPGQTASFWRLVVEHPGAVVVLAVDEDERALVLQQYRHPAGHRLVELPAGLLDQPGEDPVDAARRELLEEGGIEAEEWVHLHHLHSAPGFSSERIDIYLARGLRQADRRGFEAEHEEADMTLHWVPVDELVQGVLGQRISNGPTAVALLTYAVTRAGSGRGPQV
jgi:8-oxo-dGTP pyrophosphatase MutT (NUDIX family)